MLTRAWQRRGPFAWMLLPLACVFAALSALRRLLYRCGALRAQRLPVPVLVVGNITAGGAGKTPLVLWIANEMRRHGFQPGIISRGYGGSDCGVREVQGEEKAGVVGDEPLLLKRRFGGPVFIGRRRAEAGRALLAAHPRCDLLIADDGLQHYGLARDIELAVLDRRGVMNGWPLPAGPLREPLRRLRRADALVLNGLAAAPLAGPEVFRMELFGASFYSLEDARRMCDAGALKGLRLHAVAGIGEPSRFFDSLVALGLDFAPHAFPDHHPYTASDLDFEGDAILTTEKDAVKLTGLVRLPVWVLPVEARISPDLARFLLEKLDGPPSA